MGSDYRMFDADMHFNEDLDANSRYIEPKYRDKTLRRVRTADGNIVTKVEDRIVRIVDSATGRRPGNLGKWLEKVAKGEVDEGSPGDGDEMSMPDPAFQNPAARLIQMNEQGVEACVLYGALLHEAYMRDPKLIAATLRAWNRWAEETWGYCYKNRIILPAPISLADPEEAVTLLEWAIERGARAIFMRPGPYNGRTPGHPDYDPFWARVNEARLVLSYHITEAGADYKLMRSREWGQPLDPSFYTQSAWQWTFCYGEQTIMETIASLVFDNFFARYPNINVLTSELGCEWGPYLCVRMDKMRGMARSGPWIGGPLEERPSAIFKRRVRMQAYPQDDVVGVVEKLGPECVLAGSDWPHAEGLNEPRDFFKKVESLPEDWQRMIMRDTGMKLFRLAP